LSRRRWWRRVVSGLGSWERLGGGEEVLPFPFFVGVWGFVLDGVWEVDGAVAFGQVLSVDGFGVLELALQGFDDAVGKRGDAVAAAFAVADYDLVVGEVYVFDAQAQAFHDAQSAAVHELHMLV
jgi:hypothetical protein